MDEQNKKNIIEAAPDFFYMNVGQNKHQEVLTVAHDQEKVKSKMTGSY